MRARYIREVGTLGRLRVYWDTVTVDSVEPCEQCPEGHPSRKYHDSCKNAFGRGSTGVHNAYVVLGKIPELRADVAGDEPFGKVEDHAEEMWPTRCSHCGEPVPGVAPWSEPRKLGETGVYLVRQVFIDRLYDTDSGLPEPGDVFEHRSHLDYPCPYWDNCDGVHYHAILPDGHEWDMDSRASNCAEPQERTHRCWVKTGSLHDGTLSAGKGPGRTCAAGAGSIGAPNWHGFLTNFELVKC